MIDSDVEKPGTPGPGAPGSGASHGGVRLYLAGLALLWERLWPALWPAIAVAGLFLVLALADLFRFLPGWLHAALLAVFAVAFLVALVRAAWQIRPPGIAASRRRLERASGLSHRPLTALADRLAGSGGDAAAAALWQAHLARMAAATRRLRVGRPASALAALDPMGLRALLTLVLLIAAIGAGEQWDARLWRAVTPNFNSGPPAPPPSLDIWLTPPDYTGLAPQFLQRDYQGEPIPVPTGSAVLAQVHGGRNPPLLKLDQAATDFSRIDAQNFKVQGTITDGHRLTVEQDGAALATWPIAIVPDVPPTIGFASPPQPTQRAALRLEYQANDDYGIESVKAVITRPDGPPDEKIELDLPLPGLHPKDAKASSFHDLTPHVWAGLPVEIRLRATDAAGQVGESEPVAMTLPERGFQNPIARAIIEQRRQLTLQPTERQAVSEILSDLSARPALFRNDTVVFMALRSASARLLLDPSDAVIGQVQQLLWDTALRVEDGQLSLAQRDLREIQRRLQDALARNAPDAEIEKLMSELQQAIDKYLQSLAENMQRMGPEQLKNMPPIDPSRMISRNDLQKMLDKARELSRTGAKDAARDMLSRLQEMLENLQAGRPGQMQQGNNSQGRQAMRQMQDMMQRQQQLLDKSFRASRQGQRGQQGQQQGDQQGQQGEMGDSAGQQEALRRMLGEMMRQMGEGQGDIPQPFGRAERAMRDAVDALNRGAPGQAIGPQTEALDQLQQAARSMAEQMNQMGQGQGDPEGGDPNGMRPRRNADRDPLGRERSSNGTADGDVAIPGAADIQKSREILDELRRRSGERARPEIERDYIDRLLKRF
jgi:uncharacterized protein (TIGR02302 family)